MILERSPDDPAATLLQAIFEIQNGEGELGDAMLSGLSLKLSELDAKLPQAGDNMLFIQAAADYVRGSDRNASIAPVLTKAHKFFTIRCRRSPLSRRRQTQAPKQPQCIAR